MYSRVLEAGDIHPNLIQPHHHQRRPNGCIHPFTILLTFVYHARHPPHRPVVETLKGFIQPWLQYPRLRPK